MYFRLSLFATLFCAPCVVLAEQSTEEAPRPVHDQAVVSGSIISNLLETYDNRSILYPYEDNYVLYTYTSKINKDSISSYHWASDARKDELKYQISLAIPIWRGILGENSILAASYTQRAWWQMTNSKQSAPFRETNYEPQVFVGWATTYDLGAGWTLHDVETGLVHQSNGRSDPTSRSWNRAYLRLMAKNGNMLAEIKPWVRIDGGSSDDNPDIIKYMGHYRAKIGYQWGDSVFSIQGQYNWNTGYGGAELGWSYPVAKHVRFYTQLYSGYGESMIDYDHRQTRIGVGFTLNDIF